MISALFSGLGTFFLKLALTVTTIVLAPIDILLNAAFPQLGDIWSEYVSPFFSTIATFFGWARDASMIHSIVMLFAVAVLIFSMQTSFVVSTIKLAWHWLQKLKFW